MLVSRERRESLGEITASAGLTSVLLTLQHRARSRNRTTDEKLYSVTKNVTAKENRTKKLNKTKLDKIRIGLSTTDHSPCSSFSANSRHTLHSPFVDNKEHSLNNQRVNFVIISYILCFTITVPQVGDCSTVMSMSICLSVCPLVCLGNELHIQSSPNVL